ncbi:MAG: CRISPR-associated endonuclease Cas6 [Candidatus Aenigmatarchaeota archaeon]
MKVSITKVGFTTDTPLNRSDARWIRGYMGTLLDNIYAHNHRADGGLVYSYPRIQYKVVNGSGLLLGIQEGADILRDAFREIELTEIDMGGRSMEVLSRSVENCETELSTLSETVSYTFVTPWLALNRKNYESYKMSDSYEERVGLLEKILTGNLIAVSKGLGYTVAQRLKVKINRIREVQTALKGTPMLGFYGTFSVNFRIPEYFGIGKSVSRGFGTVKQA